MVYVIQPDFLRGLEMSVAMVNFLFLQNHDPSPLKLVAPDEWFVFEDPNTALIRICQLTETLGRVVAAEDWPSCVPDRLILAKRFRRTCATNLSENSPPAKLKERQRKSQT